MNPRQLIHEKVNDKQLNKNLEYVMYQLQGNRKKLISERYGDWEALREEGKKVKQYALSHLPELLEKFEKNATANGIKVHWASNNDEANEIILNIAKENNVNKILKGKSMASEEIGLNHYLEKKGIKAIETDLGEVIIQLIGEPPVHIVVPAIHKNRFEVGEIFEKHLHVEKYTEIEDLNRVARTYLRDEFHQLKMGLSGVNFAIADEGAIWLLENEGNGRMSTTVSDIHVAVCGIEKVVESFDNAVLLNTLLIPSATGQSVTTYNNIISSPRKDGDLDGPKEVHVVLLDNGRSNILSKKRYAGSLRCIRCGTCMNHCPVYHKIGGHAYGATYPGPIGEVISPLLFGIDKYGYTLNLCSLCGNCAEVCPVKIPLTDMIRDLRNEKVKDNKDSTILGIQNIHSNGAEKRNIEMFTNMTINPKKWHRLMWFIDKFAPLGKPFAPFISGLKQWTSCRAYPKMDASFQSKVKNMEGVKYE